MKISIWENETLDVEQVKWIKTSEIHLQTLIDFEKVKQFCKTQGVEQLMVFGSQTTNHHHKHSDLDIMIISCTHPEWSEDNWNHEQRQFLSKLYQQFLPCLKQVIEVDFKLNTSESDFYAGISVGCDFNEEADFCFEWSDIPSYFNFTSNEVEFEISGAVDDVFNENGFIRTS